LPRTREKNIIVQDLRGALNEVKSADYVPSTRARMKIEKFSKDALIAANCNDGAILYCEANLRPPTKNEFKACLNNDILDWSRPSRYGVTFR